MTLHTKLSTHRHIGTGFTLVELMVSVAMVVLLILGINQIFRITSDTINASTALGSAVRQSRAIQGTLTGDFRAAMPFDAPFITLNSSTEYAFRNQQDFDSDQDGDASDADFDGDGTESTIPATTYNSRNHRVDILNFFARSVSRRQTGNDGTYVSDMSSNEAMISYGHLRVYDGGTDTAASELALSGGGSYTDAQSPFGDGRYPFPGRVPQSDDPNPNNYFASNWVLGRVQILLRSDLVQPVPPGVEHHVFRSGSATGLSPLARNSWSTQRRPDATTPYYIQHHRFDLAATSIAEFRGVLQAFIAANPTDPWWDEVTYRFATNPFIVRPIESRKMALAAPIFVPGCSQFIVEYAGDFLRQDENGVIQAQDTAGGWVPGMQPVGDGEIDFIVEASGARRVRWYGSPRDVTPFNAVGGVDRIRTDTDVVPLALVRADPQHGGRAYFEKTVDFIEPPDDPRYVCAWGPYELAKSSTERPLMFRITVTVEDANNRLTEGQTYEYVFKLGM